MVSIPLLKEDSGDVLNEQGSSMFRILDSCIYALNYLYIIWAVYLLDSLIYTTTGFSLCNLGLLPRTTQGLIGIVTMPFLHGNNLHIIMNTIGLFSVVFVVALETPFKQVNWIAVKITLLSGALLWLFGRSNGMHVGASALIYGLTTYIATIGITQQKIVFIAYTVFSILMGGSFILGLLPLDAHVSWEGHIAGAIAGVIVALKVPTHDPHTASLDL